MYCLMCVCMHSYLTCIYVRAYAFACVHIIHLRRAVFKQLLTTCKKEVQGGKGTIPIGQFSTFGNVLHLLGVKRSIVLKGICAFS